MHDDWYPERLGHRINGDVVVRRSDPAGREQIIVLGPKRVHALRDPRDVVGHDPHLGEADTLLVQPKRDLADILVLGPT